jgi:hypothetical protein
LTVVAGGLDSIAVSGGRSMVQAWEAAAPVTASVLVPRTAKVWGASERPVYCCGEVQLVNALPSSEHSKVVPARSAENSKVAAALFEGLTGATSIVVTGASAGGGRTVHAKDAGGSSIMPRLLVATTSNVWSPTSRFV